MVIVYNGAMFTTGKTYFKDVRFPVCFEENDSFASVPYRNERLVAAFVKKGRGVLSSGAKKYIVAAPAVLLVNERTGLRLEDSHDFQMDSIYFHPSFINYKLDFDNIRRSDSGLNNTEQQDLYLFASFDLGNKIPAVVPLTTQSAAECDFLFKKFDRAIHDAGDDYCPCWIRAVLISLLIFLLELEKIPVDVFENEVPTADPRLKDIVLYLHSHYGEELTVDGIAARFGTNRTTLNARFNRITGSPVMRFLRNIRLNAAAKELRTTARTVTEISQDAGFGDTSHFCRLFREAFGCTPGRYRNMYGPSGAPALNETLARR
jgi:AraC-like DNA-binding protein